MSGPNPEPEDLDDYLDSLHPAKRKRVLAALDRPEPEGDYAPPPVTYRSEEYRPPPPPLTNLGEARAETSYGVTPYVLSPVQWARPERRTPPPPIEPLPTPTVTTKSVGKGEAPSTLAWLCALLWAVAGLPLALLGLLAFAPVGVGLAALSVGPLVLLTARWVEANERDNLEPTQRRG